MIYLHIGTAKTGSTSIRNYLFKHHDLFLQNGFYVPTFLGANHIQLTLYANPRHSNPRFRTHCNLLNDDDFAKFLQEFPEQLLIKLKPLVQKDFKIIFTNKHLSSQIFTAQAMEKLKQLLFTLSSKIKIVIYLRKQDSFLTSLYSTVVENGLCEDFITWANQLNSEACLDYHAIVNRWSAAFGRENIIIRPFEKMQLYNQNVIDDFLNLLGLSEKLPRATSKFYNQSLDANTLEFLRLFNKFNPKYIENQINPHRVGKDPFIALQRISSQDKYYPYQKNALAIMQKYLPGNESIALDYLKRSDKKLFLDNAEKDTDNNFQQLNSEMAVRIAAQLWKETLSEYDEQRKQLQHQINIIKSLFVFRTIFWIRRKFKSYLSCAANKLFYNKSNI